MSGVCGDNRFEIIAKVKEHLIKATNIESQPKELEQLDNILFRLWQLDYFNLEAIPKLKEEIEDWKACHEHQLDLMKGLNNRIADLEKQIPQWHYLTEDPNDLPKKEGPYWVCVRDGRYKENGSWEWTSKPVCKIGVWMDGVFGTTGGPPVIAWCELPTFDKE